MRDLIAARQDLACVHVSPLATLHVKIHRVPADRKVLDLARLSVSMTDHVTGGELPRDHILLHKVNVQFLRLRIQADLLYIEILRDNQREYRLQ